MERELLSFGEKLRDLRTERGLTAKKLSELIGVDDATIARWEKGQISPSIDKLYKICVYFGVSADYLLGLED